MRREELKKFVPEKERHISKGIPQEMISCNNCKLPLICPHVRDLTELEKTKKSDEEIKNFSGHVKTAQASDKRCSRKSLQTLQGRNEMHVIAIGPYTPMVDFCNGDMERYKECIRSAF